MAPTFLYQQWLQRMLTDYEQSQKPLVLRGKAIHLTPRQYGAALLQAYLGGRSLSWLADASGLSFEILQHWRRQPGFLWVMDWSKSAFVEDFCESLLLNDYSLEQYFDIAGEFALLEDSLRVRIRARLYAVLKQRGDKLLSLQRAFLRLDDYDLRLFRRLFLFFLILEDFWPSPAAKRLRQQYLPLAQEVVWPLLALEEQPATAVEQARQHWQTLGNLPDRLAPLLRKMFAVLE